MKKFEFNTNVLINISNLPKEVRECYFGIGVGEITFSPQKGLFLDQFVRRKSFCLFKSIKPGLLYTSENNTIPTTYFFRETESFYFFKYSNDVGGNNLDEIWTMYKKFSSYKKVFEYLSL